MSESIRTSLVDQLPVRHTTDLFASPFTASHREFSRLRWQHLSSTTNMRLYLQCMSVHILSMDTALKQHCLERRGLLT